MVLHNLFKNRTPLQVALLQRENESVQYGIQALETWMELSNAACVAKTVGGGLYLVLLRVGKALLISSSME